MRPIHSETVAGDGLAYLVESYEDGIDLDLWNSYGHMMPPDLARKLAAALVRHADIVEAAK